MTALDKSKFSRLLPHGPGMQLIDTVISFDEKQIHCKTYSHTNLKNPLSAGGRLPITAYLEYAAQAAGLHLGLSSQQQEKTPAAGYVGTLKDIQFYFFDPVTEELCISAEVLIKEQRNAIYHFSITASTKPVAEGRISLSQA